MNAIFARPKTEAAVAGAFESNQRLLLHGGVGSGKSCLLRRVLNASGALVVDWDFRFASNMRAIDSIAGATRISNLAALANKSMAAALASLESLATKQKIALLIRNVDSLAGARGDNALVGWLRSEVQMVSNLRIFFTAHTDSFIQENFDRPDAAFYKQVIIEDVPPLSIEAVSQALRQFREVVQDNAISGLFEYGLGNAAATDAILNAGVEARGQSDGAVTRAIIDDALKSVLGACTPAYAAMLERLPSSRQKAVLKALALGLPMKANAEMVQLTGIERSSLGVVFKGLLKQGLVTDNTGQASFTDPLLRMYLRGSN